MRSPRRISQIASLTLGFALIAGLSGCASSGISPETEASIRAAAEQCSGLTIQEVRRYARNPDSGSFELDRTGLEMDVRKAGGAASSDLSDSWVVSDWIKLYGHCLSSDESAWVKDYFARLFSDGR